MVAADRTIRRLRDTFECTQPYDELRKYHRIVGRRVLATKTFICLPFDHDSNCNTQSNEIPVPPPIPPSFATKKQPTTTDGHDEQQSKIKNMVIDELKSFFASRNQNNRHQSHSSYSTTHLPRQPPSRQRTNSTSPCQSVFERSLDQSASKMLYQPDILSLSPSFTTTSTVLFASASLLVSILVNSGLIRSSKKISTSLRLISETLLYSSSFTFGCFGARCLKQIHPVHVHHFGNMLIKSLLLHTFLTLLTGNTSQKQFVFTHQETLTRVVTSTLHLIAGFTMHFDGKKET